jgi:PPOX class probable F420-dependent enzyme
VRARLRLRKAAVVRLDAAEARERLANSAVLRLATVGRDNQPHIVPSTFVVDSRGQIAIGIDNKPKSTFNLRRLRNIADNPRVSLLADHYDDNWVRLWWVRADGIATIERSGEQHAAHWAELRAKYWQYADQALEGPVIVVAVEMWAGWAFDSP